jgi:hypothetical protein
LSPSTAATQIAAIANSILRFTLNQDNLLIVFWREAMTFGGDLLPPPYKYIISVRLASRK